MWYIVDFNHLTFQVQDYRDGALHHLFYSGLPDRLKDEIAQVGKPLTLHGLRALCEEINVRYWECKDEISCMMKTQSTSSPTKPSNSGGNCQVRVYSSRGSGQVRMKMDEGQGQGAGQGVSPAGVGDRLDSTTKDNER